MASTTRAQRTTKGFTLPGLTGAAGGQTAAILESRLIALVDLSLVLKHAHWNVVGPHFIGVHLMLDGFVDEARAMADATAERIAALGSSPNGNAGALVEARAWGDYGLMRADALDHLVALDAVYDGVIGSHREAIAALEELDAVSQDILIGQTAMLEQAQWFIRAHLERSDGTLAAGTR